VFVAYAHQGRYDLDIHGQVIDTVGVPAAAYFLWVTYALYRGALRDWNDSGDVDAGRRSTRGVTPDPALPELIGAR
jgi:hypothetical protein